MLVCKLIHCRALFLVLLLALAGTAATAACGGDGSAAESITLVRPSGGHAASLPTNRTQIGDPNAPVQVDEWGDFQ